MPNNGSDRIKPQEIQQVTEGTKSKGLSLQQSYELFSRKNLVADAEKSIDPKTAESIWSINKSQSASDSITKDSDSFKNSRADTEARLQLAINEAKRKQQNEAEK